MKREAGNRCATQEVPNFLENKTIHRIIRKSPPLDRGQLNSRIRHILTKLNSVASVRERIIPTERPPFIGEVNANFLRTEGATWSA
jgi:hypothetical protein